MTQTFYLLRHFEVEERYQNTYIGWTDAELSSKGFQAAKERKSELQDLLERCEYFFASDLTRCKQSLLHLGIQKSKTIYLEGLREKSFGRSEGMDFETIQKTYDVKYKDFLQWIEAIGGESIEDFLKRIKDTFFKEIFPHAGKENIIMTHAGSIHAVESIVKGVGLEEVFSDKLQYGDLKIFTKTGEILRWVES